MSDSSQTAIPVLTDIVAAKAAEQQVGAESGEVSISEEDIENLIAELQTNLASQAFSLTERLLHNAFSEMEATLFEQVSNRLRRELPELIDSVLRRHLHSENTSE